MGNNRSEKMGNRKGITGLVDRLRYHEASRQGFGFLLVLVCTLFAVPGESRIVAGLTLVVIGQGWRIYSAGVIYKNKQLATTGAYSLVRHPLYLGNFLILAGFTLASGNWVVALVVLFFFLFYYPAAIRYEDTKLEGLFGDDWRAWSIDIPAMFPSFGEVAGEYRGGVEYAPVIDPQWRTDLFNIHGRVCGLALVPELG